jgi:hypothetical protein
MPNARDSGDKGLREKMNPFGKNSAVKKPAPTPLRTEGEDPAPEEGKEKGTEPPVLPSNDGGRRRGKKSRRRTTRKRRTTRRR